MPHVTNPFADFYQRCHQNLDEWRQESGQPLTLSEKILYSHLHRESASAAAVMQRGESYASFTPDRVAMQDATAQMALLQFMNAGMSRSAVAASVHCDHLIRAEQGALADLEVANAENREVYQFLQAVSARFGIDFWKPGAGIIHQVVLENYAIPGMLLIGTDSHTVNGGGLGAIAIGVGGADAVDVMAGMPWELKMPKIFGIELTGSLQAWTSPKDVILKLAGLLTTKGGTNAILEYFGPGCASISCTGKATICNMGAEVGATTSLFAYDQRMGDYLRSTGRAVVAELADRYHADLSPDSEVLADPAKYYDKVITIDLNTLEPHINGPFTPDMARPISAFVKAVVSEGYPEKLEVGLIGSCTNSSYEDLSRAASLARQAKAAGLPMQAAFMVTPGSEMVRKTAERDAILSSFSDLGATVMANACGPCIGQWRRAGSEAHEKNSIITSFNRNFAKRNDGNPNTYSFVASPEMVTAMAIAGRLTFNPLTDSLTNAAGEAVRLTPPQGEELPPHGFAVVDIGLVSPPANGSDIEITIDSDSQRLQRLLPFPAWHGNDFRQMPLLIQAVGKCTTDHISMAGPWLRYRGHLDNISNNLLIGASNRFNGETNRVLNQLSGEYGEVPATARAYQAAGLQSIVIAAENYGEGSSREHAAMEPRHLGVAVVLCKSFARIHETNLKKQGMLALTFDNANDYERIQEGDRIDLLGLSDFAPGRALTLQLNHPNGTQESMKVNHTYNEQQIAWFRAGSALNHLAQQGVA
ncbi:MAG: aconitate hydratase [Gammaproteobacteria bacterium]|nr:aconitate hydratase [Gammaproteobacteria bacterium]